MWGSLGSIILVSLHVDLPWVGVFSEWANQVNNRALFRQNLTSNFV